MQKVDPAALASLDKVQKQRDAVINITEYKGMNNIPDLKCYLSYLEQLEKLFPLMNDKVNKRTRSNKQIISIPFVWADSFTRKKYTVSSIIYEKAAVMFNIAALYTQAAFEAYNVHM